jgi:chromosome segregation protein
MGADAAELALKSVQAELAAERARSSELGNERAEIAAALAEFKAEAGALQAALGERAAAEMRASAAEAALVRTQTEIATQQQHLMARERECERQIGAIDRLHARASLLGHAAKREARRAEDHRLMLAAAERKSAELQAMLGERAAALAATEASFSEVRSALDTRREQLTALERERDQRDLALAAAEKKGRGCGG